MNFWCKIFGHDWDQSKSVNQAAEQFCKRKRCIVSRTLVWNRFPKIGEPSLEWKIIDIENIKIK